MVPVGPEGRRLGFVGSHQARVAGPDKWPAGPGTAWAAHPENPDTHQDSLGGRLRARRGCCTPPGSCRGRVWPTATPVEAPAVPQTGPGTRVL